MVDSGPRYERPPVPTRDTRHPDSGLPAAGGGGLERPRETYERADGPLRVLLVEDEPAHAELACRAFDRRPGAFLVTVAETLAAARRSLSQAPPPDLVIADWRLPDGDGIDLLRADTDGALPPVVIMTSHGSERVAVETMRAGAVDYVVKSEVGLADLPHIAARAVRQRRVEETLADIGGSTLGADVSLDTIVLRLARTLRVRYASVAERVDGDRLRTLACCIDGSLVENFEYTLEGTPCAEVLESEVCFIRKGVAGMFPSDEGLRRLGAESYVGVPLVGRDGVVRGMVNAVHDRPLREVVEPEAVLRVFAARAASELARLDAQRALRASEERYRTLMRHAPEAILVADVDEGGFVDANANAEQLFGLDREQLCAVDASALLPDLQPDGTPSIEITRRLTDQALEGEAPVAEVVHRVRGGSERPCEVRVVRLPGPGRLLRISIIDIGERKRLEADLRRAALEWRQTFDGLPLGVVVVDAEGRVVRANRKAVECSGRRSWADLIDRPIAEVGPGEPWATLASLARDPALGSRSDPAEIADHSSRRTWVVGASRLPTDGEEPPRIVLNFQDVTATAQLKEQLRQNETMAAVGSIVAGVAHEVRNPLFSISATLDAFDARFGRTEGYERYLGVLRGEITRLTVLMKELLEFGRPSRPDLGTCRVEDAIRSAIASCGPLARRHDIEVVFDETASAVPPVLADRGRLVQVLQNLIENGVYFSPPGSQVRLGVDWRGPAEEDWVEISVRDSGRGFAAADLPRLFEPFFTRRRGGTGLGLSIVRRIVYDHSGEVFAWNHPEGGAVVSVRLRRATGP